MCGIVGIIGSEPVNQEIYEGLTVLQHRGQDAAGILTSEQNRVFLRKDNGLVRDVFYQRHMLQLQGNMGIGHVRYPTAGCDSRAEAQPFYVNSPFGLALSHNGNLTNTAELGEALFREDLRQINTNSDSEILLNVFAHELYGAIGSKRIRATHEDIFRAVAGVFKRCRGAYAVTVLVVGYGIVAFRDPRGIRPLVFGSRIEASGKTSRMIASESVALDVLGFELERDVKPGEAVIFDLDGKVTAKICAADPKLMPCLFEYVYLARPDSIMDDVAVYKTRMRMGEKLGKRLKHNWPDHDIDVVIPVPDTSRTSALQMAWELGIKYREGFIKNRYIGRTFIMPGQAERRKSVRQKLNAIDLEFRGKNVLLVDDSIVRGTTSKQIIQMARDAGAKKVYFASAAPPVRFPNVYGIDMPTTDELIGFGRSADEICQAIGADRVFYQDLQDLEDAVREGNSSIEGFDSSCFSGEYVTGDVTEKYLSDIGSTRGIRAEILSGNELDSTVITELH